MRSASICCSWAINHFKASSPILCCLCASVTLSLSWTAERSSNLKKTTLDVVAAGEAVALEEIVSNITVLQHLQGHLGWALIPSPREATFTSGVDSIRPGHRCAVIIFPPLR